MHESTFTAIELAMLDRFKDRLKPASAGAFGVSSPTPHVPVVDHPPISGTILRLYGTMDVDGYDIHEHYYSYRIYVGDTMVLADDREATDPDILVDLVEECLDAMEGVSEYLDKMDTEAALDRMHVADRIRPLVRKQIEKAVLLYDFRGSLFVDEPTGKEDGLPGRTT